MRKKHIILTLVLFSFIYTLFFSYLNVLKYKSFFSFEWEDDAAENQVIYNIAHSFSPHQTIFLNKYFFGHFTPIYFFIALFYKIYPSIYTLWGIVSFFCGFSSLIIYLYSYHLTKDNITAYMLALIYLLYPPLHYINLGALDAILLSLPFLLGLLYAAFRKKYIIFILSAILTMLCKEDAALIVITFGILLKIKKYEFKWWGFLVFFGVLYLVFALWFINDFSHLKGFHSVIENNEFLCLNAKTIVGIIKFFIFKPVEAIEFIFVWRKFRMIVYSLFPLLFLPLFSVYSIIPWPAYAEIILTSLRSGVGGYDSYYLAPLIPFFFVSLIHVLGNFERRKRYRIILLILVVSLIGNFFVRNIPSNLASEREYRIHDMHFIDVDNIFDKKLYFISKTDKVILNMVEMIPQNVSVSATGDLLPLLSNREKLYEIGLNLKKVNKEYYYYYSEYPVYESDYIIINKNHLYNGLGGSYPYLNKQQVQEEILRIVKNYSYNIIDEKEEVVLLRKQ